MKREADISGSQRKILTARVRPVRPSHGDEGIVVRAGRTLPFTLTRMWSAPAGHYAEQWFLINPETREVLFEGPVTEAALRGLQAPTDLVDEVTTPIDLQPGAYRIVFALNGIQAGELDVQASEAAMEESV